MGPLISAEELASRLAEARILDARPSADAYAKGHVANAIHASLDADLSGALFPDHDPARGGRHPLPPPEWFGKKLDAWGVSKDVPVVVYDDQSGANAAARAWWMIRALGHDAVYVLDGGLESARAAGLPITNEPTPAPAATTTSHAAAWGRPTVTMEEAERYASTPGWRVLDVRSAERFRGDAEPIDPIAGHVPGADNLFYGENLDKDGRFKSKGDLRAMYTRLLGDVPPGHLVVHCGSGVTACHTLLALEIAGLPGASLYVGSWSEWCRSGKPLGRGASSGCTVA